MLQFVPGHVDVRFCNFSESIERGLTRAFAEVRRRSKESTNFTVHVSEGSKPWAVMEVHSSSLGCFHCGLGSERIWKNEIFNFLSTWPNTTKRLLKISSFYSKKKSWKCCLFTKLTNTNQVISLTDLWDSLCTACFYRFILLLSKKAESKVFVIDSVLWAL